MKKVNENQFSGSVASVKNVVTNSDTRLLVLIVSREFIYELLWHNFDSELKLTESKISSFF